MKNIQHTLHSMSSVYVVVFDSRCNHELFITENLSKAQNMVQSLIDNYEHGFINYSIVKCRIDEYNFLSYHLETKNNVKYFSKEYEYPTNPGNGEKLYCVIVNNGISTRTVYMSKNYEKASMIYNRLGIEGYNEGSEAAVMGKYIVCTRMNKFIQYGLLQEDEFYTSDKNAIYTP